MPVANPTSYTIEQEYRNFNMLNLEEWGMYERDGVLIQPFPNGKAMQVKLESDNIGVRCRQVPPADANDTTKEIPEWLTAYDYILSEWIRDKSPVWLWLKAKGINETEVMKRILKLK